MPTRVQTSPAAGPVVGGNPLVITLDAAPTPGNVLVFVVSTSGSPWTAVPPGATLDSPGVDSTRITDVYSRPVVSGDGLTYQFTPSTTTATSRGVAIELTPATPGNQVVLRRAAASEALADVARTVDLPAVDVTGPLYGVAAVGLGGASGGTDTVSAPWTALTPPGPIDAGRLHVARYAMTGTDLPAATFTWATSRRAVAVAAVYGEQAPADPDVILPAGVAPLDTVLIAQPAATAGTGPLVYTITEVTAGGVVIDEHEEFYARPAGATDRREWVVPKNTVETYWRVTATSATGKTASRTYVVPAQGATGGGPTFGIYFNDGSAVVTITAD